MKLSNIMIKGIVRWKDISFLYMILTEERFGMILQKR
jgi:hypothetical protein